MLINTGLIENNFYSLIPLLFKDPCEDGKACGECAGCRVANHVAQCSCPANYYGNALISCSKSMIPCDGACECDEVGFCTKSCHGQDQCSCGEVCHSGKCRVKCDVNNYCPKVVPLFPSFQELRETERSENHDATTFFHYERRDTFATRGCAWSVAARIPTVRPPYLASMASARIRVRQTDHRAESMLCAACRITGRFACARKGSKGSQAKSATNWSAIGTRTARRTNGAARTGYARIPASSMACAGSTRNAGWLAGRRSALVRPATMGILRSTARKVTEIRRESLI